MTLPGRVRVATFALGLSILGANALSLAPAKLPGFLSVAKAYDAFLLDQFGVIHDGKNAYAGAPETLSALLCLGKRVVILSNSSRRKADAETKLAEMGFPEVTDILTSGETAWRLLHDRPGAPFDEALGRRCVVFGNADEDDEYVASAGLSMASVEDADFLLARGLFCVRDASEDREYRQERAREILEVAKRRSLPMVVANPDYVRPDGKASPMPGVLAKEYEELGGMVHYIGKPHPLVYEQALRILAEDGIEARRVVGVGDSLLHDIRGAQQAKIDSIFVASGIHASEIGIEEGQLPDDWQASMERLLQRHMTMDKGLVDAPTTTVVSFADPQGA